MKPEKFDIILVNRDKQIQNAELYFWEEDPDDCDLTKVCLVAGEEKIEFSDDDAFAALRKIRLEFEGRGLLFCCNGGLENVYPSPMSRSMGGGVRAYKLELGKQAKTDDLVSIFEYTENNWPVTVKEQEDFYNRWLSSLG